MARQARRRAGRPWLWALALSIALRPDSAAAGWIDPDTNDTERTTTSYVDGSEYHMVMSDEFDVPKRGFKDGDDPMWTGTEHSDDSMTSSGLGSLCFYNSSYVTTTEGKLTITTTKEETKWRGWNPYKKKYVTLNKDYRSGMITTWNKFCFTGGIIEIRTKFPGQHDIGGLWPAFWLLGNLGRATYEASTNLLWPFSYNKCDRKKQRAQEISACNRVDHFGMHPFMGRGATEIDVFEAQPGSSKLVKDFIGGMPYPYVSTTLQVAPGIEGRRPTNEELIKPRQIWYDGMVYGENVTQNHHFYGLSVDKTSPVEPVYRSADQAYVADGISALTALDETYFDEYHIWRLEWQPGPNGSLHWFLDGDLHFSISHDVLDPWGTQIPDEPSYVILNTNVASSWGFPIPCPSGCDCACYTCGKPECKCAIPPGFCNMLPADFVVDYVRVYQHQNDSAHTLGCDTPTHPTKRWIEAHKYRYMRKGDRDPIKKVKKGTGKCKSSADCHTGTCRFGRCDCPEEWTGPNCRAPLRFNNFSYESHMDISMEPMVVPVALQAIGGSLLVAVLVASAWGATELKKSRRNYYMEMNAQYPGARALS